MIMLFLYTFVITQSKIPLLTWKVEFVILCLLILFHRFEELTNSIKQLKNHKKIKDISKVLTG